MNGWEFNMNHKTDEKNVVKKTKVMQFGQAYAEGIVGIVIILLFLLGAYHVWRYAEVQQMSSDVARFAGWERTVWESENASGTVEKHAVHKTDVNLAKSALLQQLSTPEALRAEKANFTSGAGMGNGTQWLKNALKSFTTNSAADTAGAAMPTVTVTTTSGVVPKLGFLGGNRGRDPTFNTLTSLELDKETYRVINVSLQTNKPETDKLKYFNFDLPSVETHKKLALVGNSWGASGALNRIRTHRQLSPLADGDGASGTKANVLSRFGLNAPAGGATAGGFLGMTPWWDFLAGPNGLAGQFVLRSIGVQGSAAAGLMSGAGLPFQSSGNPSADVPAELMGVGAQERDLDFIRLSGVGRIPVSNDGIMDATADGATDGDRCPENPNKFCLNRTLNPKAHNHVYGRRRNMIMSLQSQVDTYHP